MFASRIKRSLCIATVCAIWSMGVQAQQMPDSYPETMKVDQVDNYHGTRVADPYRWLEERNTSRLSNWLDRQGEYTESFLSGYKGREELKKRLTRAFDYERYGSLEEAGGKLFYRYNSGLQNQSVLMVQDKDGKEKTVLDPNLWSSEGLLSLNNVSISPEGNYVAYAVSKDGSDWTDIKVYDLRKGEVLEDLIQWSKFSNIAWTKGEGGFFYSRYPEPKEGNDESQKGTSNNRLYYHKLGTPQSQDQLFFAQPEHPEWGFSGKVTKGGKFLVVTTWMGTDPKVQLHVREVEKEGEIKPLVDDFVASYSLVGEKEGMLYFLTDKDASFGKIVKVDPLADKPVWTTVVPENDEAIEQAKWVGDHLVVVRLQDAHHKVELYDRNGRLLSKPTLPYLCTIESVEAGDNEIFFEINSFIRPMTVYRYDLEKDRFEPFRQRKLPIDSEKFVTYQVWATSEDGTRLPVFVTHRKDLVKDGDRPTLLYGYGGFNINITPRFYTRWLPFLEDGGVFAVATLRGGSEYGEDWHQAGMLANKHHVFEDFYAASLALEKGGLSKPSKIAINGGSNGGLLVAASMVRYPEAFGAVLCEVPVLDMLRYHLFTVGRFWIPEYGNAEKKEDFPFMYAYSPLHNLERGVDYPPTMVMTGEADDRVVPAHAFKFVAALQELMKQDQRATPMLLRVERNAGHGHGKPISKRIQESLDRYSFLYQTIGDPR